MIHCGTSHVRLPDMQSSCLPHLREYGIDVHLLLEQPAGEVDLSGDIATVYLDLADVRRLLPEVNQAHLRIRESASDNALETLELRQVQDRTITAALDRHSHHTQDMRLVRFLHASRQ